MIRTRDFLLFLLTVDFLVLAITVTARGDSQTVFSGEQIFEDNNEIIYEAVLPEDEPDRRSERLDELKKKIAKLDISEKNSASVIASGTEVGDDGTESKDEVVIDEGKGVVDVCAGYIAKATDWSPANLRFEVVEGARLIYREDVDVFGTTSAQSFDREIVLQLPVRSVPLPAKKCLTDDVVGVALDGSLIRNDEHGVYGIFGAETLIGYALDGFPIYGLNDLVQTDSCGGVIETGQYRYYLSSEREGVIGCYSGLPVSI